MLAEAPVSDVRDTAARFAGGPVVLGMLPGTGTGTGVSTMGLVVVGLVPGAAPAAVSGSREAWVAFTASDDFFGGVTFVPGTPELCRLTAAGFSGFFAVAVGVVFWPVGRGGTAVGGSGTAVSFLGASFVADSVPVAGLLSGPDAGLVAGEVIGLVAGEVMGLVAGAVIGLVSACGEMVDRGGGGRDSMRSASETVAGCGSAGGGATGLETGKGA